MDRTAILEFVGRDWARLADAKVASWRARKIGRSAAEILEMGDQLRRYAQMVRPDWPTEADRVADLEVQARVAEALRAVGRRSRSTPS